MKKIKEGNLGVTRLVAVVVIVIVLIVAGAVGFYAYQSTLTHQTTTHASVNIGVFTEISGQYAQDGGQTLAAVQIGAAEVNAKGGVDIGGTNYTLNVISADVGSDPSQAPSLASAALSQTSFLAAIGPDISGMSLAIEPAFETAKVPWVEGGISNSLSSGQYKYFFSTSPNVTVAGNFEVTFMQYLNSISPIKSFAIFYENSEYGQGTANSTEHALVAAGFNPSVYTSYPTPLSAADAASLATAAKQANVQFILPISNSVTDGETIMQAMKAQNVTADVFGEGPAFGPDIVSAIGSAANYVLDNDGWFPDIAPTFAASFLNKTGNIADVSGGSAYNEFWALVGGLQGASAATTLAVQQSLETMRLTTGPAVQYLGGPVQFSSATHRMLNAPLFVAQDINGTYHTVYPASVATATVVWPPPSG